MCKHGTYKEVSVINPNQNKKVVVVDACIAEEIQLLNNLDIITLGCCCGHGKAGEITEYVNAFGKWKEHHSPPHALIDSTSVETAKIYGYRPFPYYYADGEHNGVWQMFLKTGCITEIDVEVWHETN
ncbi:hypothetical protein [Robertmurraya siralis]|uniref:hypothetical protein n=1 Tax=Robertmurraya siralis TaxID=77777 RepID=UPI0010F4C0AA|nr:hypothetical protein [Robertmurraya siralis]